MAIFIPPIDLKKWIPGPADLTQWYYEMAQYLSTHPSFTREEFEQFIQAYIDAHPIEAPVTSVNNKTGAVELTAADVGAATTGALDIVKSSAETAQRTATAASRAATNAQQDATKAQQAATNAGTAASNAQNSADAADAKAGTAQDLAGAAKQAADRAEKKADAAYGPTNPPPETGGAVKSVFGRTGDVNIPNGEVQLIWERLEQNILVETLRKVVVQKTNLKIGHDETIRWYITFVEKESDVGYTPGNIWTLFTPENGSLLISRFGYAGETTDGRLAMKIEVFNPTKADEDLSYALGFRSYCPKDLHIDSFTNYLP